ncbi:MAG: hypothetical protein ABIK96_11360 [bacterium]
MNAYFILFISLVVLLVIGATVVSILMSTTGGAEMMESAWKKAGKPGADKEDDPPSA